MWKRLVAAAAALVLAVLGVLFVVSYANRADERALESLETVDILVAQEQIAEGTAGSALADLVQLTPVPRAYVADGAVDDLAELEGLVLTASVPRGEQLSRGRFATPEELRRTGQTPIPEDAVDLHQVTIPLTNPRALGGNISSGDTVGVFMSFDIEGDSGYVMNPDGSIQQVPDEGSSEDTNEEGESDESAGGSISTTHLTLHKVLVARVEGGAVAPPAGEPDADAQAPEDTIHVTLALEAPDAEKLVFAMEFGQVWLSLEPEGADEDGTGVVVVTVPNEGRDVYQ